MENQKETVILEIEGSPVECPKEILIANSDYFSAMFKGSFRESSQKTIKIEGVDLKSFNTILLLLWDEFYLIDTNEIHLVLQAACMLQFSTIKKICEDRIMELLNPSTCLRIWKTTEMLDISPLWLKAKCMALEEFNKICDSNVVLELSLDDICTYLGHIYLNVHHELFVFQTAMNWWYENQENYEDMDSTKIILRLLNCVDFKKLKDNEIREMRTYPDIADNSEIISILNCVIELLGNGINICSSEYSIDQMKYAIHLCNARSRQVPEIPCILLQTDSSNKSFKKSKSDQNDDRNVVIYDSISNGYKDFFSIDGDKVRDLAGFKLIAYKEFVLFYGGEYLIGVGNWNCNLWMYDTIKERWLRKNMLPHGRRHFETILVDDCVFIIGGVGKFRVIQDNLLWYSFKSDTWSTLVPLPTEYRHFKCCSFKGELLIVYLAEKRAYFFNKEMKTWRTLSISIEKEVADNMGNFTVFTDSQYFYAKGKFLIKFKLVEATLVPINHRVIKDIDYEEIESVLCNNIAYTLYECLDEHYNFCYTFEALNLETDDLRYIFKNKVQGEDTLDVGGKLLSPTQHIKLFSLYYYCLVKENVFVNDFVL